MPQPASRTRFYRDKRNGKVMGVCAGIADYTGIDVNMVRMMLVVSIFMSGGSTIPLYFIAGWISPDQPREVAATAPTSANSGRACALRRPHGPRDPQPDARDRPPPGRHRALRDHRKPQPGARNRKPALTNE